MLFTTATVPPVLAAEQINALVPGGNIDPDALGIQHIAITELGIPDIHGHTDTATININNPLTTGIMPIAYNDLQSLVVAADAISPTSPADPILNNPLAQNLTTDGYSLTEHTQHAYIIDVTADKFKEFSRSQLAQIGEVRNESTIGIFTLVDYYTFHNQLTNQTQLLTATQPITPTGKPMGDVITSVTPLDVTSLQAALEGTSITYGNEVIGYTSFLVGTAAGTAYYVAYSVGATLAEVLIPAIGIGIVVFLITFCIWSMISPTITKTDEPITNTNPIYEFTLNKDTNSIGRFIPPGSKIVYSIDGSATVTEPKPSWWKRPFASQQIIRYIPVTSLNKYGMPDPVTIPHIVEVPNHASIHNSMTDTELITEVYDEDENLILVLTEPKVEKPKINKRAEVLGMANQSWVEWAQITPPTSTTAYTYFSSAWTIPPSPLTTSTDESLKRGSLFYTWNGLQGRYKAPVNEIYDKTGGKYYGGIIQPLLIWNCGNFDSDDVCTGYPSKPGWSAGVWVLPKEHATMHTPLITNIKPGYTITGTMKWIDSEWVATVTVTDLNGATEQQTIHAKQTLPNDATLIEPYICLEKYQIPLICSDGHHSEYWPQGNFDFSNIKLQDQTKKDIITQATVKGEYDEDLFKRENYLASHCRYSPAKFELGQYWVDTSKWPLGVSLNIPVYKPN